MGLTAAEQRALQQQIMLFYTSNTRSADSILTEQNANVESTIPQLNLMRDLADFGVGRLRSGDVDAVGSAIRQS
jgi:D-glycero-alpha-D-manno-heptose-7-phosphate kinase